MSSQCANPTIDRLLSDPLTLALIRADKVDRNALAKMLHGVAERLRRPATSSMTRGPAQAAFERCGAA